MSEGRDVTDSPQARVITVTLNPALDLAANADAVVSGKKLRLDEPVVEPGGGGVNVARAIARLGGEALPIATLGGMSGARLARLMRAAGQPVERVAIEGETRQGLTVADRRDGAQYRFVLPGPPLSEGKAQQVLEKVGARLIEGAIVVLSGSQPPGLSAAFPATVARLAAAHGARLVVDTSGPALARLIETPSPRTPPFLLRLDEGEARRQAGGKPASAQEAAALAEAMVTRGVASVVVVARGASGSVLVGAGQRLSCAPPEVTVESKVGAGDSFTGGFVLALARGEGLDEALRLGTAAAAAAVMTPATELCRGEDVARLLPQCRVQTL